MLQKTRGIVLNYIKFKETSVIVKMYTEDLGIQSYIVNGIRSKTSKKSLALFQPLTILDLVVYSGKNENREKGIMRLSEYKPLITFQSIPFDIKKSAIAIFITELVMKTLKEEQVDENGVFDFLTNSIKYLDSAKSGYENFHIQLMIQLVDFIGFNITDKQDIRILKSNQVEADDYEVLLKRIFELKHNNFQLLVQLTNTERRSILNIMNQYYSSHIENFGKFKSQTILEQVFN